MTEMAERIPSRGSSIVTTTCASHCGGSCLLKLHVKDGVVTHIETDDGPEPQLRACLRGRAYRQRVYAPDRVLYPMKRIGQRGEGKLVRISWDEAIDAIASNIVRVRDTYGAASICYLPLAGDVTNVNTHSQLTRVLRMAGGYTHAWGVTSFQSALYAQLMTYGTLNGSNTRDDMLNSRFILMWAWNPASTINGVNSNWYLARARENGTRIVVVDPKYTDSAAAYADEWVPIRPTTDGAALLGMAYVMIEKGLQDRKFLDTYTVGFDRFRDYVTGKEDGVPKTPRWASEITGVPADTIARLARDYATLRPAALMAGIAPGRTSNGDQYHRIAMTLAAMTGNVGVHGGDAGARSWESLVGGLPFQVDNTYVERAARNPIDSGGPRQPGGTPSGYRPNRVHHCEVPDFIEKGKAAGYPADCKLIGVANFSWINSMPNVNRYVQALKSGKLEFLFVLEQFFTPTTRYADIVLPTNTYFERNDFANSVGEYFYGMQPKAIESLGESKSQVDIANLLGKRLGLPDCDRTDEDWIKEMVAATEIASCEDFKKKGVHWMGKEYVAFKKQIDDPANNPFPTPSGKIEIYSERMAELNRADIPGVPKYQEGWENWHDPLRTKYPLLMISTHLKRRTNNQFHSLPWLLELERQELWISTVDAAARGIKDGDQVRVFNDRGEVLIPAKVTERIMPGVVDMPQGSWYQPDQNGVDHGGCANVLTSNSYSPGGSFVYNSCLVEVKGL